MRTRAAGDVRGCRDWRRMTGGRTEGVDEGLFKYIVVGDERRAGRVGPVGRGVVVGGVAQHGGEARRPVRLGHRLLERKHEHARQVAPRGQEHALERLGAEPDERAEGGRGGQQRRGAGPELSDAALLHGPPRLRLTLHQPEQLEHALGVRLLLRVLRATHSGPRDARWTRTGGARMVTMRLSCSGCALSRFLLTAARVSAPRRSFTSTGMRTEAPRPELLPGALRHLMLRAVRRHAVPSLRPVPMPRSPSSAPRCLMLAQRSLHPQARLCQRRSLQSGRRLRPPSSWPHASHGAVKQCEVSLFLLAVSELTSRPPSQRDASCVPRAPTATARDSLARPPFLLRHSTPAAFDDPNRHGSATNRYT